MEGTKIIFKARCRRIIVRPCEGPRTPLPRTRLKIGNVKRLDIVEVGLGKRKRRAQPGITGLLPPRMVKEEGKASPWRISDWPGIARTGNLSFSRKPQKCDLALGYLGYFGYGIGSWRERWLGKKALGLPPD